jgi:hypothetical protein
MKHFDKFCKKLREQILPIVIFATIFVVVGYFLPRIYFEYFDTTVYYSFDNPSTLDKAVYKPCDYMVATTGRLSLVSVPAVSIKTLVLVRKEGNVDIFKETVSLATTIGTNPISARWKLACDLEEGTYFYRGVLAFKVNGVNKHADFYTTEFRIEE